MSNGTGGQAAIEAEARACAAEEEDRAARWASRWADRWADNRNSRTSSRSGKGLAATKASVSGPSSEPTADETMAAINDAMAARRAEAEIIPARPNRLAPEVW